jgi:DNA-binding HxlR family transcriptional regulator
VHAGSGAATPVGGLPSFDATDARLAIEAANGRWVVPVLQLLARQAMRRGELYRALGGKVQQKVLTETLQRMATAGLIVRTVLRPMPPAVLYELTDRGRTFLRALSVMAAWAAADRPRLSTALLRDPDADGPNPGNDTQSRVRLPLGRALPTAG